MTARALELADLIEVVTLPDELDLSVLDGQAQPECTPPAEVGGLGLEAGVRDVQALMQKAWTPADLAAIGALVRRHAAPRDVRAGGPAALSLDQSVSPPRGLRCVPGSLHVAGDLSVVAPLVVCGDLRVDGLLRDCGPQSKVVVLGDLHVGALQTTGEVWVLGSLHARRYVWGHYNDNVLEVAGAIRAPLVLSSDHAIEAPRFDVVLNAPPFVPDDGNEPIPLPVFDLGDPDHLAALRQATPPEAWDADGRFDIQALEAACSPPTSWTPSFSG